MRLITAAALGAAFTSLVLAAPATANDAASPTPAPKRIDCTHEKDAKGVHREDCDARAATHEPQTHKMVRCNEEAGKKQLHGDERRAFMSTCLKG